MATQMYTLGDVVLAVPALAATQAARIARQRWAAQERVGARPGWQWLGPGEETLTLSGVSLPLSAGTADAVSTLRTAAAGGEPLTLADGAGRVLGRWVVRAVEERRRGIRADGTPARIDWRLDLALYEPSSSPPSVAPGVAAAIAVEGEQAVAALNEIELLAAPIREQLEDRKSKIDRARELVRKGASWRDALQETAGDLGGELDGQLERAGLKTLSRRLWGPQQLLTLVPDLPGEGLTSTVREAAGA